jgi:hypothetical protein
MRNKQRIVMTLNEESVNVGLILPRRQVNQTLFTIRHGKRCGI